MKLLLFAVAGLMAQLVDGALGMAFGVTATTMLILSGTAPAQASAAVHFAEVGTTLFSGIAHWRLNNVHWPTVIFLGIPGAVGAFIGATVLAGLSAESAEPVVSTLLLLLGAYVLIRSILVPWKKTAAADGAPASPTRRSRLGLVTLGLGGGFLDASGGGGWGPVTTSTLMSVGRSEPRKIIGTVNTAEFLVAVAASAGFIIGLDRVHESWQPVLGLLIGGLIGAPIAAWIVTVIKPDILGGIVGAVLVGLNGARVSVSLGWFGGVLTSVVVVVCLVAVIRGLRGLRGFRGRRGRRAAAYPAGNDDPQGETSDSSDTVVITVDAPR
ncbi:sulfite exporter TauE/SafE family protein [Corynebacterium glyciniphilum]|uniref:sulfite exporter TauE/SafE family protein n=2 Tax=Corynebacterium glyciniphilum TaxID=1404244 RepID=UPI0011AB3480|nr:sulfite exporter TauE/SafE family protein [Corynebacterium glyciniphilum]